ncbi:MAG: serine/threonine protein kinase [Bradymonadia bacterium]|jgi:serine/threonine protein kinase
MLRRVWICPECRSIYTERAQTCERDSAPLAEVQAHQTKSRYPLLGKVVGDRYHLIGGLGQGGLGTVYLAQHLHLGQLFAVKFLDVDALIEQDKKQKHETRRDFLKEARVASLIRHDSVVRVSDFGEHERLPFLVMEYVPGPSLLHVIGQRGRFPEEEAISIARRIGEALDAFHERRLVHRDLKPANVILDPRGDGRLTLVDLGLVKDLSGPGGRASTHPMALRGTPGYLAPEQVPAWVLGGAGVRATSDKALVDARVDIYALGVILYEMLAGVSPYPDGTNTQIIVYCCTRDAIPFTEVHPPVRLRPGLAELVYDTMSRDPSRRPQSAADFLEQLDAVAMGVSASRTSWPALVLPDRPSVPRMKDSLAGLVLPSNVLTVPPRKQTGMLLGAIPEAGLAEVGLASLGSFEMEATQVFNEPDPTPAVLPRSRPAMDHNATMDSPIDAFDDLPDLSQSEPATFAPGDATVVADDLPDLDNFDDAFDDLTEASTRVDKYTDSIAADLAPRVEAALMPSVRGGRSHEPPPPPLRTSGGRKSLGMLVIGLAAAFITALIVWMLSEPSASVTVTPVVQSADPVVVPVRVTPNEAVKAVPATRSGPEAMPRTADAAPSTAPTAPTAPASIALAGSSSAAPATKAATPATRARSRRRAPVKATPSKARPSKTQHLSSLIRKGDRAFNQKRHPDALTHYRAFLKDAPADHPKVNDIKRRIPYLLKLIKKSP